MALRVLKQQVEQPAIGSGSKLFPAGDWKFTTIDPATYNKKRTRPTPDFMSNAVADDKTPRVASPDSEILSVWLGQAEALAEGQADAGDMKFFQDFVIRDGKFNIMDLDIYDDKGRLVAPTGCGWQIAKDATLLGQLAVALGATYEVTEGDKTYVELAKNFVDMLKAGDFDGKQVAASVIHKTDKWKDKTTGEAKSKTQALISQIWSL